MSKASKNTSHRKLYTVGSDAPFQYVEAYKSLRTNLEFLSTSGNCKTILITSSVPEEGKSNVALNLAMTLTASGNRVVLVDCDLRKAKIFSVIGVESSSVGFGGIVPAVRTVMPESLTRTSAAASAPSSLEVMTFVRPVWLRGMRR